MKNASARRLSRSDRTPRQRRIGMASCGTRLGNRVTLQIQNKGGRRHAKLVADSARRFLDLLKLDGFEITVTLVNDAKIRRLNRIWRKIDQATDVLSFSAGTMPAGLPGPRHLGDLVISLETAEREASERSTPISVELRQYVAHGLLHLLGYDHVKPMEARRMARLERKLLDRPGMLQGSGIRIYEGRPSHHAR